MKIKISEKSQTEIEVRFKIGEIVHVKGIDGPKMVVVGNNMRDLEEYVMGFEDEFLYLKHVICGYYDKNWTWIEKIFEVDLLVESNAPVQS